SLPHSATRRALSARAFSHVARNSLGPIEAWKAGSAPAMGVAWRESSFTVAPLADQSRSLAVPVDEVRRYVQPEKQHDRQMDKYRDERRGMRQPQRDGLAEHHRLHLVDDCGAGHVARVQQDRC